MRSLASCSSAAAMPQASTSARTSASAPATAPATPMTTLAARRRSHRCPPSRRWSSSASALNSDPATRPRPSWTLFASSEAAEARAAASSGEEAPPSTSDRSSSISPTSAAAATAAPLAAAATVVRARRPLNQARVATLGASKSASRAVDEGARPLAEYMALPVSQYSVLDARRIERLDENRFRCYVDGVRLFSFSVEPVVDVEVEVAPGGRGPTVRLLGARLEGSKAAVAASDAFEVTMANAVRWMTSEEKRRKEGKGKEKEGVEGKVKETDENESLHLTSDTQIELRIEVPAWFRLVPLPAVERVGSRVMQRVLDVAVPRFLDQLARDYKLWSESGGGERLLEKEGGGE